jgi:hypothetical protein
MDRHPISQRRARSADQRAVRSFGRAIQHAGLALFALVAASAASAAELPASIARCAEVADNLERLTCYDRQNPPRQTSAPRTADDTFGANADLKRKQVARDPTIPREPDRITAKVVRVSEERAGEPQFELANGQVWQQTEHRMDSIAETGDEITINRGALGSYFLVGKSKLSTRVKRVR